MDDADFQTLNGQLLVASPTLVDPNFRRTVVLIAEHSPDGAMGLVLNRALELTVAEAVPPLQAIVEEGACLHYGGPVQPQGVIALGEYEDPADALAPALGDIGFVRFEVETTDVPGSIVRARIFAGYSGWGPGQLESELGEEAWIVEPAIPEDVFTPNPEALWAEVLRRKGGPYAVLALMPPDPSLN